MSIHRLTHRLGAGLLFTLISVAPALAAWDFPQGRWGSDRDSPNKQVVGVADEYGNVAAAGCIGAYPIFFFGISERGLFEDVPGATNLYLALTVNPQSGGSSIVVPAVPAAPESGLVLVSAPDANDVDRLLAAVRSAQNMITLGVIVGRPTGDWTQAAGTRNIASFSARGSTAAINSVTGAC